MFPSYFLYTHIPHAWVCLFYTVLSNSLFRYDILLNPFSYCVSEDEEDDDFHLAPSSADDAPRAANPSEISIGDKSAVPTRPSGRVIGIIKRNWHS